MPTSEPTHLCYNVWVQDLTLRPAGHSQCSPPTRLAFDLAVAMAPKTVMKKPAQNKGSPKVSGPTAKKPAAAVSVRAAPSPAGLEKHMLNEVAIVVTNHHDSCDVTARCLPWLTNKSFQFGIEWLCRLFCTCVQNMEDYTLPTQPG